jgi:hypothetical protein
LKTYLLLEDGKKFNYHRLKARIDTATNPRLRHIYRHAQVNNKHQDYHAKRRWTEEQGYVPRRVLIAGNNGEVELIDNDYDWWTWYEYSLSRLDPRTLSSIKISQINSLPECSGLYFLLLNGVTIYIGRARNLKSRWKQHHIRPYVKGFERNLRLHYIPVFYSGVLKDVETKRIAFEEPLLNGEDKNKYPDYTQNRLRRLSQLNAGQSKKLAAFY